MTVAAFLALYRLTSLVYWLNSIYNQNLNRIGYRLSWATLAPTQMPRDYHPGLIRRLGKFCLLLLFELVSIVLSWLSVVYFLFASIKHLMANLSAPQSIKDARWRLRHQSLSAPQVIDCFAQMISPNADTFEDAKMRMWHELLENQILSKEEEQQAPFFKTNTGDPMKFDLDEEGDQRMTICPKKQMLAFRSRSSDEPYESDQTYEYRIIGISIEMRLIHQSYGYPGKGIESVKDGVVLTSQIEKRLGESDTSFNERIANLRRETEWVPITNRAVTFFVLSKHPEKITASELRRAIRADLDRIQVGARRILEELCHFGMSFSEDSDGLRLSRPFEESSDPEGLKLLFKRIHDNQFNVSWDEISYFKKRTHYFWLGEEPNLDWIKIVKLSDDQLARVS